MASCIKLQFEFRKIDTAIVYEFKSDQPSSNPPSSDQPSSDQPSSDQPSSDRPSSDRPSSDRPRSDHGVVYQSYFYERQTDGRIIIADDKNRIFFRARQKILNYLAFV